MKLPGPDHPITLSAEGRRATAVAAGQVIADTGDALIMEEAGYPPVAYFPASDVKTHLARTDRKTVCPYKGEASYYSLNVEGHVIENAAWCYETPYPAMARIAGRLAFYGDRVEIAVGAAPAPPA